MAVTKGHGNPKWTRDEVILALELYLDCKDKIPSSSDPRVQSLSALLRSFPHHAAAAKKPSFRNPDGVSFKLQNLRQVDTGKGLGNISRIDREVWDSLGASPTRVQDIAAQIRAGVSYLGDVSDAVPDHEFAEGAVVTATHLRRERNPNVRAKLIASRRQANKFYCEMCWLSVPADSGLFADALFEAHHVMPLSISGLRITKLTDMALLCACCHRLVHRAISMSKEWLTIEQVRQMVSAEFPEWTTNPPR